MTVLLIGADGMVGYELKSSLAQLGEVVALSRAEEDLCIPAKLRVVICRYRHSLIVNAGAYVDRVETDSHVDAQSLFPTFKQMAFARFPSTEAENWQVSEPLKHAGNISSFA